MDKLNVRMEKVIDSSAWDAFVTSTYGRPYNLQQQNGCYGRGRTRLTVPDEDEDENMHDAVPEVVNHELMGVKFATWLARDPKAPLAGNSGYREEPWATQQWWARNFYPDLQTVANDLCAKGLLEAGDYTIDIDW